MHWVDFYLVLVLGFISSLHCLQMCGPIVLSYSVSFSGDRLARPPVLVHVTYNAGRILTYMVLGGVAGAAGRAVGFAGRMAGVQNATAIVAGAAMLLAGIAMLGLTPAGALFQNFALPARFLRPMGRLISSRSAGSKFALGLLLGLLPCGLVYAVLLRAAGTASVAGGAMTMLAFGLGTSAALLAIGVCSSLVGRKLARWGTAISAVSVMVLGALLILRGAMPDALMMDGGHMHHHHP
jgi:hypothetical protein